ncbi:MAG: hypothetical protein WEA80_03250 [Gemmatimonadaceae bacterium]
MKIAVCVKRVPDMDARFRISADGTSLDEAGLKFDINEPDAWAVEAALQLKEKAGQGEGRLKDAGTFTPQQISLAKRNNVSMATDIAREARR